MPPTLGFCRRMRLWVLALALVAGAALADEYTPVTELMRAGQWAQAMARAQQYLATKPRDPQMRFLKGLIEQDLVRQHDGDRRVAFLLRVVAAFQASIGTGKDNLGHRPHLMWERAVS